MENQTNNKLWQKETDVNSQGSFDLRKKLFNRTEEKKQPRLIENLTA